MLTPLVQINFTLRATFLHVIKYLINISFFNQTVNDGLRMR